MKGFGKFRQRRKKAEKSPVSGGAKFQDSHDADEVSLVVVWLFIRLLYMYKYKLLAFIVSPSSGLHLHKSGSNRRIPNHLKLYPLN